MNDEVIIEGIITIFEIENRTDTIYNDQSYAGLILKTLHPKSYIKAELILNRTLKNWNKSIEELPFWLRHNYGIETLKKAFAEIENNAPSDFITDKIKTMKWWLRIES